MPGFPTRITRFPLVPGCGAVLLLLGMTPPGREPPEAGILGRWHGTSICVKADWNAACNDEEVLYDFAAVGARTDSVSLHAARRVGAAFEPMYDLDFHFDRATSRWTGAFQNARVSIEWRYEVRDTLLTGTVILLPSGQVGRNVVARRLAPGAEPPPP